MSLPDPRPVVAPLRWRKPAGNLIPLPRSLKSKTAPTMFGGPKSWGPKKLPKGRNWGNFCTFCFPRSESLNQFQEPVPLLQTTTPPSALQCKPLACWSGDRSNHLHPPPDYIWRGRIKSLSPNHYGPKNITNCHNRCARWCNFDNHANNLDNNLDNDHGNDRDNNRDNDCDNNLDNNATMRAILTMLVTDSSLSSNLLSNLKNITYWLSHSPLKIQEMLAHQKNITRDGGSAIIHC